MAITMRDVADHAGVSIKTVSRVVNHEGELRESTRLRVQASIDELGYFPSRIAQALTTQRTFSVGLIIPDITNPFFPEVTRGVQDQAEEHDYNVFMCNTDDQRSKANRMLQSLTAQSVDGIIVFSSLNSDEELCAFADHSPPIVAINRQVSHPNIGTVMIDNYHGTRLVIDHLVERGHRKIGMLRGFHPPPDGVRRLKGYRDGLIAHGLPVKEEWIVVGAPTIEVGRRMTIELLSENPEITALFAYNDLLAIGAMRACKDLQRHVPMDCAVAGFDDIELTTFVLPMLTSVHVDKYAVGRQAMDLLLEMIARRSSKSSSKSSSKRTDNESRGGNGLIDSSLSVDMPVQLMIREST